MLGWLWTAPSVAFSATVETSTSPNPKPRVGLRTSQRNASPLVAVRRSPSSPPWTTSFSSHTTTPSKRSSSFSSFPCSCSVYASRTCYPNPVPEFFQEKMWPTYAVSLRLRHPPREILAAHPAVPCDVFRHLQLDPAATFSTTALYFTLAPRDQWSFFSLRSVFFPRFSLENMGYWLLSFFIWTVFLHFLAHLALFWLLLALFWPYFGPVLALFLVHFWSILDLFWPCFGLFLYQNRHFFSRFCPILASFCHFFANFRYIFSLRTWPHLIRGRMFFVPGVCAWRCFQSGP